MAESVELPAPQDLVAAVVEAHRPRFAQVLEQAWESLACVRSASPQQMSSAGASTRGMLLSDFAREPAHRLFDGVPGVSVDDRYGRAWVCLAGGRVQVRFRKLTPTMQICVSDSERATRLAFHLGDPLLPEMPEAQLFLQAVDFANLALPGSPSVVSNSIASALEGHFGDHHRTWRTKGSKLFISPLMSQYWSYEVDAVCRRCLYLKELLQTRSYTDVERVVSEFRKQYPPMKGWEPIPH